jgi:hypothetical protein
MVISGGQTGADEAGLRAAKVLGYKTGGMMPHGWKTEAGPRPEFQDLYGMVESRYDGYEHRTRYNIRAADATIVFFLNRSDGGTGLTMAACVALVKPLTTCEWPEGGTMFHPDPAYVQRWIRGLRIKTLNIAGNRESKSPGIGARVEAFLLEALQR